jgi:hypothetical protein
MKKIIFLIGLLLSIAVQAQTFGTADKWIAPTGGTEGTTTSVNAYGASAVSYTWGIGAHAQYYWVLQVKLADVSAGSTLNTAAVTVTGSLDGTTFAAISNRTYSAGGTDTTIFFSNSAAYPNYKFIRLTVTPSDSIKIDRKLLKVSPLSF